MKKILLVVLIYLFVSVGINAQEKLSGIAVPERNSLDNVEKAKKLIAFRLTYDDDDKGSALLGTDPADKIALMPPIRFNKKDFDSSNSIRNNSFVAPESGLYQFDIRIDFETDIVNGGGFFKLSLCKSPMIILEQTNYKDMTEEPHSYPYNTITIGTVVKLNKGDVVFPSFDKGGTAWIKQVSFSGFEVN